MFVSEAFAEVASSAAAQPEGMEKYSSLLMLGIMFAIFYFLLIRPQQKRAKEHKQLIDNLKVGDAVVTAGGMHGKVSALQEDAVTLEVATGVKIKFNRSAIMGVKSE